MASPMVESRIEPHKKAHFSLHISDRIANDDSSLAHFSSVKYNHKPTQTSKSRTTKLTSTSTSAYNLRLEDKSSSGDSDMFTFTGNRAATKKSYVLLFDPSSQKATLEPLSDSYTFNISKHNNKDISSQHAKIYPKKSKDEHHDEGGEDDLFGEVAGDDDSGDPDPGNPYDFRHFLGREKDKRGDESEYNASSPDYRTGTGSAMNTPQFGARKAVAAVAAKSKVTEPVLKKRKTAESSMFMKKKNPTAKKAQQPPPSIHLERRASERPAPDTVSKPKSKASGPPASKIKSAELVHSSDDSDNDAEGEAESVASPPPRQTRRSPSPQYHHASDHDDEEDADGDSDDDGDLEIEVPDARPSRGALASLNLGQNLGVGGGHGLRSPSNGPISLASATNSNQGSPNPHTFTPRKNRTQQQDEEIDFGDLGGAEDAEGEDDDDDGGVEDDQDVDDFELGPPARQSTSGHERKYSMPTAAADEDEEDPLYREMMAGLADGDSSEESEEE